MTPSEQARDFTCPDCGGFIFRPGPRGGLSQNLECVGCRSRFNVACWRGLLVRVERISNDSEWREDMFPQVLQ
ncbi:hypothetical protein JQ604_15185 [Bradyrhizobium jicamae]|uniref:hypothetical protein n=1 Tax=Bradyrhizobium jicamae TaxID=280332 RepID=UPI001BA70364|nr:hypothetical protein [Bradyrhizobium jicamae]MBR0753531.1 hypothetical protein [Bradyrhizobium jicamae]